MTALGTIIGRGVDASKPAAGTAGALYISTDKLRIYRDNGTSWDASGMDNPMTAAGDVIYGGASGLPTRLAIGSTAQVLTVTGGVPVWAASAAGAVTQLYDSTLGTTAASFDLTSISSAYNHLRLEWQLRGDFSDTSDRLGLQLNADTGSNYDTILSLTQNGTSLAGLAFTAHGLAIVGYATLATSTANATSVGTLTIPNYAKTTFYKAFHAEGGCISGAPGLIQTGAFGSWRSTAAVNEIKLYVVEGGNFIAGSRVSLYGIL